MDSKKTFDRAFGQLERAEQQLAEENKTLARLKNEEQEEKRDLEILEDEVKNQERLLAPLKEEILECQAERGRLEEEFLRKEEEATARLETRRAELETRCAQNDKETAARQKEYNEKTRTLKDDIALSEKELGEMRHLLVSMKEESEANFGKAVLKEREKAELRKELDNAKAYIETLHAELKEKDQTALSLQNDLRTKLAESAKADLGLNGQAGRAHELLEKERKEFKAHYADLEKDFEDREKELIDEIRSMKEADTKRSIEYERMSMELSTARDRLEAAESKASSASIEIMELNVYNKSAAAALREKEAEIADLKKSLDEARLAVARTEK